jgi:hypothetical protein
VFIRVSERSGIWIILLVPDIIWLSNN